VYSNRAIGAVLPDKTNVSTRFRVTPLTRRVALQPDLLSVGSVSPELHGLTELTSCVTELDLTDCQDSSIELKLTD
jgi:hypothetical protein